MTDKTVNTKEIASKAKAIGPWALAWERFRKNKVAVAGAILFILILLLVTFGPMF